MAYNPVNPNGQASMANSAPVVVASDQSAVPVSADSLPLPTGGSTSALQTTGNTSLSSIDGKITAVDTGAVVVSGSALPTGAATSAKQDLLLTELQLKADLTETQPVSLATAPLPTGAATAALQTQPGVDIGDVTINNASGGSAVNIQDGGNTITVDGTVNAAQSGTWTFLPDGCATATVTSVADQATSISLLASTATRMGAIFFNDSASYLYVKLGTTASTTSFTYKIDPYGTLELPSPVYTGAIDGIWSADASGSVRITELSA